MSPYTRKEKPAAEKPWMCGCKEQKSHFILFCKRCGASNPKGPR